MTERAAWILLTILYGIGAYGTYLKARTLKDSQSTRRLWVKFGAFACVVYFILLSSLLSLRVTLLIFGVLSLGGLFEVYEASRLISGRVLRELCIGLYFSIVFLFLSWLKQSSLEEFLSLFALTVIFDGFCQVTGQLVGRTKLTPTISPQKTVEGLILGGLIAYGIGIYFTSLSQEKVFLLCISALLGDLIASAYKRRCGIKDFSDLIPGHGGILDRFDSFLMVGAVSFFLSC